MNTLTSTFTGLIRDRSLPIGEPIPTKRPGDGTVGVTSG